MNPASVRWVLILSDRPETLLFSSDLDVKVVAHGVSVIEWNNYDQRFDHTLYPWSVVKRVVHCAEERIDHAW